MSFEKYPSRLLEQAVEEFNKLPGIGRKTALRLVLHLLKQDTETVEHFAHAIAESRRDIRYCRCCHNICDTDLCNICSDPRRDASTICVVENIQDVMAIENTQQYHGRYHVLGGIISPMDGVGPGDLQIQSLIDRVKEGGISLAKSIRNEHPSRYVVRGFVTDDENMTGKFLLGCNVYYWDRTLVRAQGRAHPFCQSHAQRGVPRESGPC